MMHRLLSSTKKPFDLDVKTAVGGHGKALTELASYQKPLSRPGIGLPTPDLLVVAIDANCKGFNEARSEIERTIDRAILPESVFACPDPHVERWLFADEEGFRQAVGALRALPRKKCERNFYETFPRDCIRRGGHVPLLGGLEFADDIIQAMNLERAEQADKSLRRFLADVRGFLVRSGMISD